LEAYTVSTRHSYENNCPYQNNILKPVFLFILDQNSGLVLSRSLSLSPSLSLFQAEDLLYLHIRPTVIKLAVSIKPAFQRVALSPSDRRYEDLSPADKDFRELLCFNAIKKI